MTATVRLPLGEIRDAPSRGACSGGSSPRSRSRGCRRGSARRGRRRQQLRFAAGLTRILLVPDHDLVNGRRMELEALHDTVVRHAAKHGVAVPANEAIYAVLRPWALTERARRRHPELTPSQPRFSGARWNVW